MTSSENSRGTTYWWAHGDIVDFLWGKWSPGHPDFTDHQGSAPSTMSNVPDWLILAPPRPLLSRTPGLGSQLWPQRPLGGRDPTVPPVRPVAISGGKDRKGGTEHSHHHQTEDSRRGLHMNHQRGQMYEDRR